MSIFCKQLPEWICNIIWAEQHIFTVRTSINVQQPDSRAGLKLFNKTTVKFHNELLTVVEQHIIHNLWPECFPLALKHASQQTHHWSVAWSTTLCQMPITVWHHFAKSLPRDGVLNDWPRPRDTLRTKLASKTPGHGLDHGVLNTSLSLPTISHASQFTTDKNRQH